MTGFTKDLTESCTLAGVLRKVGVKVKSDSITMADATVSKDSSNQYSTLRKNNPDDALALLVTKINTITNTKTLNYIDVVAGRGNSFVGVLQWEMD